MLVHGILNFLQKSGIRKFRHNEGQKYKEGFIMNKHAIGHAPHKLQKYENYHSQAQNNVIQEDEPNELNMKPGTFKGRKPEKQMNFQNIFTQTFGSFDQNPPKTAKFDTFKKNFKKGKHYDQNSQENSNSAFSGTNFSETFKMQGPMKTPRLPREEKLVPEQDAFGLKKGKSNFCEDINKDKQMFSEEESMSSHEKLKISSTNNKGHYSNYQPHSIKFGVINEGEPIDESMGNEDDCFTSNFMSGQIPIMQGFEFENENEGFGNFPSYTPVANANKKKAVIGTEEDRNSKGIAGLLELAGTKYQMDQDE